MQPPARKGHCGLYNAAFAPPGGRGSGTYWALCARRCSISCRRCRPRSLTRGGPVFWHARIMRELELTDEEYTDFAAMNAGVLAPSRNSINPYYLGVKLLEDIERRWDNPTEEERQMGAQRRRGPQEAVRGEGRGERRVADPQLHDARSWWRTSTCTCMRGRVMSG